MLKKRQYHEICILWLIFVINISVHAVTSGENKILDSSPVLKSHDRNLHNGNELKSQTAHDGANVIIGEK